MYAWFVLKFSVTPSEELPLAFMETGHLSLALTTCSVLICCPRNRFLALGFLMRYFGRTVPYWLKGVFSLCLHIVRSIVLLDRCRDSGYWGVKDCQRMPDFSKPLTTKKRQTSAYLHGGLREKSEASDSAVVFYECIDVTMKKWGESLFEAGVALRAYLMFVQLGWTQQSCRHVLRV